MYHMYVCLILCVYMMVANIVFAYARLLRGMVCQYLPTISHCRRHPPTMFQHQHQKTFYLAICVRLLHQMVKTLHIRQGVF